MTTKKRTGAGRPPKIRDENLALLLELVEHRPTASIQELADMFAQRTGISVTRETVHYTLRREGIKRHKPKKDSPTPSVPKEEPAPYRYSKVHRMELPEQRYPSSLTDAEWALVAEVFERKGPGKPSQYPRRELLDAICYVVRSGCSWRMLPKDFPPWQNVYATFRRWTRAGLFEQMHDRLRAMWREREDRAVEPTAAIVDAQSVRTSERGGPHGFDAGKKIKGRKRHLVTDTCGLILAVWVSSAGVQDRDGAQPIFERAMEKYPSVSKVWADGGYAGECASELRKCFDLDVEVVRRTQRGVLARNTGQLDLPEIPTGFEVLPRRWVVERTNAWSDRPRRMAKEYDGLPVISEAWIWLTHARLLARRIAHSDTHAERVSNT